MAPRPGLSTAQRHRSHGRNSKPQTTDTCSPPSTQHYLSAAAGTLLGAAPGRSLLSRERFLCTQNPAGFPWWKLSAPGCPRRVCPSLRAVNQRGDRAHFSIIWSKRHQCSAGAKKVRFQQNSIFSVLVLTKRRRRRKSPWRTHGQMSRRAKQSLLRVGKTFQPRSRMHKLHPEPKAAHHSCVLPTAPQRDPELCRRRGSRDPSWAAHVGPSAAFGALTPLLYAPTRTESFPTIPPIHPISSWLKSLKRTTICSP